MDCRICGNGNDNKVYQAREMMFGTRDEFTYFQCGECGCLQITDPPENIADYYPGDYYSYGVRSKPIAEKWIRKQIALHTLGIPGHGIGASLRGLYPNYLLWLNPHCHITFDSKILDVGSGAGKMLLDLADFGFRHLEGVDPFVTEDIQYDNGVSIFKRELADVQGQYDLVMLHHSLEHMWDQQNIFHHMQRILAPGGTVLIRVPVADSWAWEHYGTDWVEMDPPRHYFLHTQKSLEVLAEERGMQIAHVLFDSSDFEVALSENWKNDIASNEDLMPLSRADKKQFRKQVQQLNEQGRASRACFYLRRK